MFDRFTDRARKAMGLAREASVRHRHDYIAPEHMLLGLLETDGVAKDALKEFRVSERKLAAAVEKRLPAGGSMITAGQLPFTPLAKTVLHRALEEASALDQNFIGTEHLLLGLVRDEGDAGAVLRKEGLTVESLREKVCELLGLESTEVESTRPRRPARGSGRGVFDRFTDHARRTMGLSRQVSQRWNHDYIAPEHILLGMLEVHCTATEMLRTFGVPLAEFVAAVESGLTPGASMITMGQIPFTPRAKTVLGYAYEEAEDLRHYYIGTEHLLLGLLRDEGPAGSALRNEAPELDRVRVEVQRVGTGAPRSCRGLVLASGRRGAVEEVVCPALTEAEITQIDVADPETCDAEALERLCCLADVAVLVAPTLPALVFAAGICRGVGTPMILFANGDDEVASPLAGLPVVSTADELRDILR